MDTKLASVLDIIWLTCEGAYYKAVKVVVEDS